MVEVVRGQVGGRQGSGQKVKEKPRACFRIVLSLRTSSTAGRTATKSSKGLNLTPTRSYVPTIPGTSVTLVVDVGVDAPQRLGGWG